MKKRILQQKSGVLQKGKHLIHGYTGSKEDICICHGFSLIE